MSSKNAWSYKPPFPKLSHPSLQYQHPYLHPSDSICFTVSCNSLNFEILVLTSISSSNAPTRTSCILQSSFYLASYQVLYWLNSFRYSIYEYIWNWDYDLLLKQLKALVYRLFNNMSNLCLHLLSLAHFA